MTYKGSAEKANVANHRPYYGSEVGHIEQSRTVEFDEPRHNCIAKEVKRNKAKVVGYYCTRGSRLGMLKLVILMEYDQTLEECDERSE